MTKCDFCGARRAVDDKKPLCLSFVHKLSFLGQNMDVYSKITILHDLKATEKGVCMDSELDICEDCLMAILKANILRKKIDFAW